MLNFPNKQRLPERARQEASGFTLAVVMAGIAAFFIAAIASAFIYANDTNPVQTAKAPPPAETTGSGSGAK